MSASCEVTEGVGGTLISLTYTYGGSGQIKTFCSSLLFGRRLESRCVSSFEPLLPNVSLVFSVFIAFTAFVPSKWFLKRWYQCAWIFCRLYCEDEHSELRLSSQTVMYYLLNSMIKMIAPILPHLAEEALLHHPCPCELNTYHLFQWKKFPVYWKSCSCYVRRIYPHRCCQQSKM